MERSPFNLRSYSNLTWIVHQIDLQKNTGSFVDFKWSNLGVLRSDSL